MSSVLGLWSWVLGFASLALGLGIWGLGDLGWGLGLAATFVIAAGPPAYKDARPKAQDRRKEPSRDRRQVALGAAFVRAGANCSSTARSCFMFSGMFSTSRCGAVRTCSCHARCRSPNSKTAGSDWVSGSSPN